MTNQLKYDLEESYIAVVRDDVPALNTADDARRYCVDEDGFDPDQMAGLRHATRVNNRIVLQWLEGEDEDERYHVELVPSDPDDQSDVDWRWEGDVSVKYYRHDGGLHADSTSAVAEKGRVDGWLFEDEEGCIFVGRFHWEESSDERIVFELYESQTVPTTKRNNQITGNLGMYYACYQLSKIGLNVLPTSRNAKGADVIAYAEDQKTFFTIQVKAMTKLSNISLGESLENVDCDWWIIVFDVYEEPKAYILKRQEIIDSAKLYQDTHWAQKNAFADETALDNWERIIEGVA